MFSSIIFVQNYLENFLSRLEVQADLGPPASKQHSIHQLQFFLKLFPWLGVDEGDDPRAGGLDELDVGCGYVGHARPVVEPPGGPVARVGEDPDDRSVVEVRIRSRAAGPPGRVQETLTREKDVVVVGGGSGEEGGEH